MIFTFVFHISVLGYSATLFELSKHNLDMFTPKYQQPRRGLLLLFET